MDLRGTVGILTGASRGIGVYLAQELARKGVDLALAARSAEDLEATAKLMSDLGARSITVPTTLRGGPTWRNSSPARATNSDLSICSSTTRVSSITRTSKKPTST